MRFAPDLHVAFGRRARRVLLACLALAGVGLAAGRAEAEINLVFGVYASDKPSAMVQQLRPTLDIVERSASALLADKVAIKLDVLRDYDTGVDVLTSGRIDFARLGAASYVAAKAQSAGIDVIVAERF